MENNRGLSLYYLIIILLLMSLIGLGTLCSIIAGICGIIVLIFIIHDHYRQPKLTIDWQVKPRIDGERFDLSKLEITQKQLEKYSKSLNRLYIENIGKRRTKDMGNYFVIANIDGQDYKLSMLSKNMKNLVRYYIPAGNRWHIVPATFKYKHPKFFQDCTTIHWCVRYSSKFIIKWKYCSCREFIKTNNDWYPKNNMETKHRRIWGQKKLCKDCYHYPRWRKAKWHKPDI